MLFVYALPCCHALSLTGSVTVWAGSQLRELMILVLLCTSTIPIKVSSLCSLNSERTWPPNQDSLIKKIYKNVSWQVVLQNKSLDYFLWGSYIYVSQSLNAINPVVVGNISVWSKALSQPADWHYHPQRHGTSIAKNKQRSSLLANYQPCRSLFVFDIAVSVYIEVSIRLIHMVYVLVF